MNENVFTVKVDLHLTWLTSEKVIKSWSSINVAHS